MALLQIPLLKNGEDEELSVENLVRYGVSWGLFDSIDTLEKVRDRVRSLVDKLKYRCLLLGGHDHDLVKMHDVIRDVMVSIASKDRGMHTLTNVANLNDKSLRDSTAISLPSCESDQLPESSIFDFSTFGHGTFILHQPSKSPNVDFPQL